MVRRGLRAAVILAGMTLCATPATPAFAHSAPFTYLDVRIQPGAIDVTLAAHIFDLAHDLGISAPEQLLEPAVLAKQATAIVSLLQGRLAIDADSRTLTPGSWSSPAVTTEQPLVRIRARYSVGGPPGVVVVTARLFPYDPAHQTFVNIYEGDALISQQILDVGRPRVEYFPDTRRGVVAAIRRFLPAGVRQMLVGQGHVAFLAGLLLLGGSMRRLTIVVGAFAVASSAALALAAYGLVTAPARLVDPAIALGVVYVGADNLLVHGGRDVRAWIAAGFGVIHGFGFAGVLREMDLAGSLRGWSVFAFGAGVEMALVMVVTAVAAALAPLGSRGERARHQLVVAGSCLVIAAGTFWFVKRVFFPGGLT
jgi:hypothetical protein